MEAPWNYLLFIASGLAALYIAVARFRFWKKHGTALNDLGRLAREADRLRQTDPEAADHLLAEYVKPQVEAEEAELGALRARASSDERAAGMLRARLAEHLRINDDAHLAFEKEARKNPEATAAVLAVEADSQGVRTELTALEAAMIKRGWLRDGAQPN